MVSAWTVALAYQTFRQLSEICRRAGGRTPARGGSTLCWSAETAANVGREIGLQHVHARGWRVPAEELSALLDPERNLVEIEL